MLSTNTSGCSFLVKQARILQSQHIFALNQLNLTCTTKEREALPGFVDNEQGTGYTSSQNGKAPTIHGRADLVRYFQMNQGSSQPEKTVKQ